MLNKVMATPAGLEPATYPLGGDRSIQLSHGALRPFCRFCPGNQAVFEPASRLIRATGTGDLDLDNGALKGACERPDRRFQSVSWGRRLIR